MANPDRQRDVNWLYAVRTIAYHISKIGDVVAKCADDAERAVHHNVPTPRYSANPRPSQQREPEDINVNGRQPQWAWRRTPNLAGKIPSNLAPHPTDTLPPPPPRMSGPPGRPSSFYYHPEYPPMSMEQRFPTSDRQLEEHDLERYSRKRRAPAPTTGEDLYPVQGIQGNMPRLKRVRVNWTSEENDVFFDTVRRNSTMDEQSIIRAIVASLGGKRNWTQCKGHFRNLVFVKKITLDEKSKRWSVDPNAKRPSRDTASSTRNSDQSLSESDAQPGEKVENTKGRPLKKNPSSQQEEVQDIDRDEDEDEDIVEVEDVELGGGEDEADDNYVDQDDEDHSEIRKVNKPKVSENESGTKKRKIRDTQVQSGTNGVGQGRTVPTNRDTTPSERSPRAMNNDRRGSEVEDGPRTMPHKKQLNVPKLESISRLYSSPPRKAKDPKRRNTADYRPTGYAEGRRYLKQ